MTEINALTSYKNVHRDLQHSGCCVYNLNSIKHTAHICPVSVSTENKIHWRRNITDTLEIQLHSIRILSCQCALMSNIQYNRNVYAVHVQRILFTGLDNSSLHSLTSWHYDRRIAIKTKNVFYTMPCFVCWKHRPIYKYNIYNDLNHLTSAI